MSIGSPPTRSSAISAPEKDPSQRWCASGSGSAAPRRNCLSLKSKLKLRWSTGSCRAAAPASAWAGRGRRRNTPAARSASEGRVAGQKLVGAVAAQNDFHLASGEAAQEMGRQNRRIAERLVEPACDLAAATDRRVSIENVCS